MSVISITVETEAVVTNNLAKGEHVDGEDERAKHRSLRYAMIDWSQGGVGIFQGDILFAVGKGLIALKAALTTMI